VSPIEFLNKNIFFTTRGFAFGTGVALATASRQLKRFAERGDIVLLTRGIWAQPRHPYFSIYGAVPFLLGNEQGYVSFLTALHRHGVISQIPRVIQVATTGHGRVLSTPIGDFEFFHIDASLMRQGIEPHEGRVSYNLATAEKALLDALHLSTRKGRRFRVFPELEFEAFRQRELKNLLANLKAETRRRVEARLMEVRPPQAKA
jgi:predicted transcriptional regulator of viral defense system